MEVKRTTFSVVGEDAHEIDHGTILDVSIYVRRKIEFKNGSPDRIRFEVRFAQNEQAGGFRWQYTKDQGVSDGMEDSHVIATHEAAEFVTDNYNRAVDLGQLDPTK